MLVIAVGVLTATDPVWSESAGQTPDTVRTLPLGLPEAIGLRNDTLTVAYGAFLFQSRLLSANQSIACTSCHVPSLGFSGSTPVAIGLGGARANRRAAPLINLYAAKLFMADGRATSLLDQVHRPIESAAEMGADWPTVLFRLKTLQNTKGSPRVPEEQTIDKAFVIRALAAYVNTLVSGDSPLDKYYFGGDEQAIDDIAKEGLVLFVRKGRCATCHLITSAAAPFTDGVFHNTGVGFERGQYKDLGRFYVTGQDKDKGAFKTPSLRNAAQRRYFMHDGSMISLKQVVEYYNRGGSPEAPNLDARIRPLFLTDAEIESIVAFLMTLTSPVRSYQPLP